MPAAARLALVAAVTALLLGALAWFIQRGKPERLDGAVGAISPEKISAAVTVVVGIAMMVVGVWQSLAGHGYEPLLLLLVGAAIAGFMAPSLTHMHDLQWSEDGVAGPSKMFGPTLGVARTRIRWPDIVKTGATITGYWYIETNDRRRIYWSYLYKGNGAFAAALRRKCPGVTVPSR
jgi:hypothetical protein